MPLSRLENFIKNVEGNILYVNPSDLDATDSIENQGNSLTRPFKTIQRALIEAARFSYQVGPDNDKFDKTTILVYPGIHKIDNRPGYSIHKNGNAAQYKNRNGSVISFGELTGSSNFDIEDPENVLHVFNGVNGGVIVPRGTSLVGLDLRKTKMFPMFVPDPQNSEIDATALFKITGGCYFWQFSIFDGDPNGQVYKNYTNSKFTPNFSHHKLTVFEYADGRNSIALTAPTGGTDVTSDLTDLDTYYFKIANAFGNSSGRPITNWPSNTDIEPKLAENQIVGAIQADAIGITSAYSTSNTTSYDPTGATGKYVVITTSVDHNLAVGTPIILSGITTSSTATSDDPIFNADGGTLVSDIISSKKFVFTASSKTSVVYAHLSGDETIQVEPDTVTGASPYIFNISLRSVYGVNGLHADGNKATGFKSMVLAQYTGIGLQKDDNAFLLYDESTGSYKNNNNVDETEKPLHINSRCIYKPDFETTHVKVSNSAILQCVSIFAIGFANHFVAESGGDQSITNSNSNFGAKALIARGFRDLSFNRDDSGYITHVIPPKETSAVEEDAFWVPLNVGLSTSTSVGYGYSDRLYAFGYTDIDSPPTHIIDSYRIGARSNDLIKLELFGETKSAKILMQGSLTATTEKVSKVTKTGSGNSITSSTGIIGLDSNHEFDDGETIRIFSDNGIYPDGLEGEQVYFVIKTGVNANQIKVAKTFNQAIAGTPLTGINNKGGKLTIVSRVSDKLPGDAGHPIQYDSSNNNWYVGVQSGAQNTIYSGLFSLEKNVTGKTFISRKPDGRNLDDRIYKLRYVIPKEFSDAKPPSAGYVIQESKSSIVANSAEYGGAIQNLTDFRNVRIIHDAIYDSGVGIATITSEKPHGLLKDSSVKLNNIRSTNNATGVGNSGFNGIFEVESIVDSKKFTINLPSTRAPGTYVPIRPAVESDRDENQPNFSINKFRNTFYIYRINTIREYVSGKQDGIYHLTCLDGSITPTASQFSSRRFSQNVVNLYPQLDRDNYNSDPESAISVAQNYSISKVTTDDLRHSVTKEFVDTFLLNNNIGYEITNAEYDSSTGIATFTTNVQHGLDNVRSVSIASSGAGYGYAALVGVAGTTIYNATLTGGSGEGMTITFTVNNDSNFGVISPTIIDGGSGYQIGDTLTLSPVGIPTFTDVGNGISYSQASFTVSSIQKSVNNPLQVSNVVDFGTNTDDFNGIKRITGVPSSKKVEVLLGRNIISIGTFKDYDNGIFNLTGEGAEISTIQYTDTKTGIVTVTCATPHGLNLGNKFAIDYKSTANSDDSDYSGTYIVLERIGINTFTFKIGDNVSLISSPTNTGYVLPAGYSSQESDSDESQENIERRMVPFRVGISTTLNGDLTKSSSSITLSNSRGFEKGDYLEIGPEIIRVTTDFTSNNASIIRGLFGTKRSDLTDGSLVKKIKPIPCEGRRYSILRASGHTFEYVGFGPGNYSNALPQRQDRNLSKEEQLLTQSEKSDGGVVVYTGMNDSGDFYVGNRRLSSATGQEETIGIPVPSYVGDDTAGTRLSVVFDDVTVKENIKVEGGASNIIQSEFNGPVLFTNKVINNSDQGADFKFITLKGTTTGDPATTQRKITVGISTPSAEADNSVGDVVFKNNPEPGGYLGWVFAGNQGTEDTAWRKFGLIATEDAEQEATLGTDSTINSPLGNFTILPSKIGINTNIPQSVFEISDGTARLDQLSVAGLATFYAPVTLASLEVADTVITNSLESRGLVSFDADRGFNVSGNTVITGFTTFTGDSDINGRLDLSNSISVGNAAFVKTTLTVCGNTTLNGTLTVSGHTDLNRDLNVSGNTSLQGTLVAKGAASFASRLDVKGNTSLGGTLYVSGNTDLDGSLTVSGATNITNTLTVSGHTDLNRDLNVSGNTSLHGTLVTKGAASFASTLDVKGNTSLGGTLTVSGATNITNTLTVSGHTDLNRNLNVSGNTSLQGTLVTKGAASFASRLDVKGNTSLGGTLDVSGATNITNTLTVSGHTDLNRDLNVSGNTSLHGTLVTKGATSFASTLDVKGNTSLGGTLTVCGNTDLDGTLSVSGNTDLDGTLDVSGNTSLRGKLYVSGTASFGSSLDVSGNTSLGGTLTVSGHTDLNRGLDVSGATNITNTLTVSGHTDLNRNLNVSGNTSLHGTLKVIGTTSLDNDVTIASSKYLAWESGVNRITHNDGGGNVQIRLGHNYNSGTKFTHANAGAALITSNIDNPNANDVTLDFKVSNNGGTGKVVGDVVTFGENFSVKSTGISAAGTLTVSGHTDLNRGLDVSGNTSLRGKLYVSGTASFGSSLDVFGNTSLGGTLRVKGHASFDSDITICGNTLYTGRLTVSGTASIGEELHVTGNTSLGGTLFVLNNADLDGTLSVSGDTDLSGTLDVTGATNIANTLNVTDKTTVGNLESTGTASFVTVDINTLLKVNGTTCLNSGLIVKDGQELYDGTTVKGSLYVSSTASFASSLDVSGNTSLGGTLTVSGNTSLDGTLNVSGATVLDSTLTVAGNTDLNRNLTVSGNTTLSGTLRVVGNTSLDGNLNVSGTATFDSNLNVNTGKTFVQALRVNGTLSADSNLIVVGTTSLDGTLNVSGATVLDSTLNVTGKTTVGNLESTGTASFATVDINTLLKVNGTACLNSGLIVRGATTCINSGLIVKDGSELYDGTTVRGTLYVSDATTLKSTLTVSGNTSLDGNLNVSGATVLDSTLRVVGNTSLDGNLNVSGTATFDSNLNVNTGKTFVQALRVSGTLSADSDLTVSGNTSLDGTLNVSGATVLDSTLNVTGNTTLAKQLTVTKAATFDANLTVTTGKTFVQALRVNSTLSADSNLIVVGTTSLDGTLNVSGATVLDSTLNVAGATNVTGATNIANTLNVTGKTTVGNLESTGTASFATADVNTRLKVNGTTCLNSGLIVRGATTCINSGLIVRGGSELYDGTTVRGTLTVSGNTSLDGNLNVSGATVLDSTLYTAGATTLASTLNVVGNTTLAKQLTVTKAATFDANLTVTTGKTFVQDLRVNSTLSADSTLIAGGATTLKSTLTVSGNTDLNRNLTVSGNTTLSGTLRVVGTTSLDGTLNVTGKTTVGNLESTGTTCFGSKIHVGGTISGSGNIKVDGSAQIDSGVSLRGGYLKVFKIDTPSTAASPGLYKGMLFQLQQNIANHEFNIAPLYNVNANSVSSHRDKALTFKYGGSNQYQWRFNTPLNVAGTLSVDGKTTLTGGLEITGEVSCNSKLTAKNTLSVGGNLFVSGRVNTLNFKSTGTTCFNGGAITRGNFKVVAGTTCLNSGLIVKGGSELYDGTTVKGSLTVSGVTYGGVFAAISLSGTNTTEAVAHSKNVESISIRQENGRDYLVINLIQGGTNYRKMIWTGIARCEGSNPNPAGAYVVGPNAFGHSYNTTCASFAIYGATISTNIQRGQWEYINIVCHHV